MSLLLLLPGLAHAAYPANALILRADLWESGNPVPLVDSVIIGPGGDPIDIQERLDATDGTYLVETIPAFRELLLDVRDYTGNPILHV